MTDAHGDRRSGLLVPLFSCRSSASWGIGEIGDLAPFSAWLAGAGQRVLLMLPINEMAPGQQSPYSAISAMAIDPIYISLGLVPDFVALGGTAALTAEDHAALAAVRQSRHVQYALVRALKTRALRTSFNRFVEAEWLPKSARGSELARYIADEGWWLNDYALFRAIHADRGEQGWTEWPDGLKRRDPAALAEARESLGREVLYRQYLQWLAHTQWVAARRESSGVAFYGDLPFMVDGDSADVWARQGQFRLDASVGVPPDAFSATGQDWGMPPYRWDVQARTGYAWLRERARRSATLYDGYRVDHLVGFYRTYTRPHGEGEPGFSPADEADQLALGERMLALFREPGAAVIAEDLGTVPDFVRASLTRLGVPGYRVFRWERFWHAEGQPFCEPTDYPERSVATTGTHDTEPMAAWWDEAGVDERRQVSRLATLQHLTGGVDISDRPFDITLRDVLLETMFASGSDLLILPIQDVFGWRDRINVPALVADSNWSFTLPWLVDQLTEVDDARERQTALAALAARYGR